MTTPAETETTFMNNATAKGKDNDDIVQSFLDYVSSSLTSSLLNDLPDSEMISNPNANASERLLKEQIDPSSLTYLQDLLVEMRDMRDQQQGQVQEQLLLVPSQAETGAPGAATPALSKDGPTGTSTTASATGSRQNPITPLVDAKINDNDDTVVDMSLLYETMKKQSFMIQELYMKVLHMDDKISQIINQQQQQQQQSMTSIATTTSSTGNSSNTILNRFSPPSTTTSNATTATATATATVPAGATASTAPRPRATRNNNNYIARLRSRTRFFFRKLQHIYHLYNALRTKYHQHYYAQRPGNNNNNNNNIDFFMIIKVLVMITIVMSRLQPEQPKASTTMKQNNDDDNEVADTIWNHFYILLQYTMVAVFVLLFILYKTKRLQFIYFFYYKYNIPKRIMSMKYVEDNVSISQQQHNVNHNEPAPAALVFVTADEIWADHLASNNAQQGQANGDNGIDNHGLQQPPDQRQNRGAEMIVGDFFRRQQQLVQWVLLHDWFNGRPIHNNDDNNINMNNNNNNNNNNRNVPNQHQILEHAPLMRPLEDDLIFEPNPVVAPPTPEQQQVEAEPNMVTRLVRTVLLIIQDIIVFIISFIVSILPIWRNIDPQQFVLLQQHQRQRNHPHQQRGPANNNNINGGGGGIPIVQPPIDPAEEIDD